jgi:hypothetical protein
VPEWYKRSRQEHQRLENDPRNGKLLTAQVPKSHEISCPGGQTANDPKLKENQLNIKWDMIGQILQEDL